VTDEQPSDPRSPRRRAADDALAMATRRVTEVYRAVASRGPQLDMERLGRVLLHAALVGAAAGLVGTAFVWALEHATDLLLHHLAGYVSLCAAGESCQEASGVPFRPWVLVLLPAAGALLAGVLSHKFAPETLGGGTDNVLDAFHHRGGALRRRVAGVKALASVLTLGSGGAGGREGPTMQIGGAIGSLVGRLLRVPERERRILLVAGIAAGMSAVFRTPLGAALLAVEVLYRDDFETDALVPAVLASVVGYSVFVFFFGPGVLFAHSPHYALSLGQLPLYGLMAIVVSLAGATFVSALKNAKHGFSRLPVPAWSRPALGGLALGVLVVPVLILASKSTGGSGQGVGLLGGGYGAAQVAITGAAWLPPGWQGVSLLLALAALKIVATSITVGSGGSAGDFGPSLVIGGLVGGAFGRAAQILVDPGIDPGAFALVGMGTLYAGIAHVPLASLVLVCELAGSYDLLVPLMLAIGVATVGLRKVQLYHAQVVSRRDSPAHRHDLVHDVLRSVRVGEVLVRGREWEAFEPNLPAKDVVARVAASDWQDVFPVTASDGRVAGMITADVLRSHGQDPDAALMSVARDLMQRPVTVSESTDLHTALVVMMRHSLREVMVTERGRIVGFLDEAEIGRVYHDATVHDAEGATAETARADAAETGAASTSEPGTRD
jgi:CIC family chloride channel protein